jgi:hypothetical protein
MLKHIGTKLINATPMTRLEYNKLRGWTVPENENPEDAGYLVEYLDGGEPNIPVLYAGYVSWSPADVFEKSYKPTTGMTFGLAIESIKAGFKVARAGWNGQGMWIAYGAGTDQLVYARFWNQHARLFAQEKGGSAPVLPYILIKTANDEIQMGWTPSQSDILALDWQIVE